MRTEEFYLLGCLQPNKSLRRKPYIRTRQRVPVLDRKVVEASLIDTQPKRSVRFPVKKDLNPLVSTSSMEWSLVSVFWDFGSQVWRKQARKVDILDGDLCKSLFGYQAGYPRSTVNIERGGAGRRNRTE